MLQCDRVVDCLMLDGVSLGRGTTRSDLEGKIAGSFKAVPGAADFVRFEGQSGDLHVTLGLRNGLLEGGMFFVALPRPGKWEELEENEAWRRKQHEAIMQELFGSPTYVSPDLNIELVREPRNLTEQIRFFIPER